MQFLAAIRAEGIPIVEDVEAVSIVADRRRLRSALAPHMLALWPRVALPNAAAVHNKAEVEAAAHEELVQAGRAWVVKPAVACGVHESHQMALVLNREQLPVAVRTSLVAAGAFLAHACGGERRG